VSCFNECCADLRLILTPYDILRMTRRLGLPAGEFIERFTREERENSLFPMLRLKMGVEGRRACPFVTEKGCSIYEDRPGACRLYPLGRGASSGSGMGEQVVYFVVKEAHCLGFGEEKEWSLETWLDDQGVRLYNEMNRPWMEIVTSRSPRLGDLSEEKIRMFCMTSYNLDRFRQFVFGTRFLQRFPLAPGEILRMERDDEALMILGMRWLKFALLGENTLAPQQGSV
jgi:Fe-S-cluster containining protein